jgi:hypothetical protein
MAQAIMAIFMGLTFSCSGITTMVISTTILDGAGLSAAAGVDFMGALTGWEVSMVAEDLVMAAVTAVAVAMADNRLGVNIYEHEAF